MSSAEKKLKVTAAEYLAYDDSIAGKSEFYDGEIYDMDGGSWNHSLITTNVATALNIALTDSDCTVHSPDLKVHAFAAKSFMYPDVQVVCEDPQFSDQRNDILINPTIILEVLSPTTAAFDRSGKFKRYRTLASLREYVLIEQDSVQVDVFARIEGDEWRFNSSTEFDHLVKLDSLGLSIPAAKIYAKVRFEENEDAQESNSEAAPK